MITKDQFVELFGGTPLFVVEPKSNDVEWCPPIENTISDREIVKIEKQARKIGGQPLQDFVTCRFVGGQLQAYKNEARFWIPCKSLDILYDGYLKSIGVNRNQAPVQGKWEYAIKTTRQSVYLVLTKDGNTEYGENDQISISNLLKNGEARSEGFYRLPKKDTETAREVEALLKKNKFTAGVKAAEILKYMKDNGYMSDKS